MYFSKFQNDIKDKNSRDNDTEENDNVCHLLNLVQLNLTFALLLQTNNADVSTFVKNIFLQIICEKHLTNKMSAEAKLLKVKVHSIQK